MSDRNYGEFFASQCTAQLEKLKQNEHKATIEDIELLFDLLKGEIWELSEEIDAYERNLDAVRHEAADVANYAGMLINECDRLLDKT